MNRLEKMFKNKKVCIPFITAGDPGLDITEELLYRCEEEGADIIELGIPFSDPAGEGTLKQEADERALKSGCTTDQIFSMLKKMEERFHTPVVLRTYMNPVYIYGKEKFLESCVSCRIAGVIVSDLPYEERDELEDLCKDRKIPLLTTAAPASEKRISKIAKKAEGYIHCLVKEDSDAENLLGYLRMNSDLPCVAGISDTEHESKREVLGAFDGAVLETGILRIAARYGTDCPAYAAQYVRKMRKIMDSFVN